MPRTLITGGAGFIGSHLVDACLAEGHEVAVYDNFSNGRLSNIEHILDRIDLFECDLRNLQDVRRAMEGVDYVLHQGALGSVPRSIDDPITSNAVNVGGTLNVLVAAKEAGVKRLVLAGSSSVYGDTLELPKHEGMPLRPKSPYALTKVACEEYFRVFWEVYGLETMTLRYFNVFGPRQNPKAAYAAVIPLFIDAILDGRKPIINGSGLISRDFTYVENAVLANLRALAAPKEAVGRSYNAGAGGEFTLLQLIEEINRSAGTKIEPEFGPARTGDVEHSRSSIEAASKAFGYEPKVSFAEGVARTVAYHMNRRLAGAA